ncbi:nucleoside phosphorylase domain-containing protein [Aspergillus venezuelensis]
MTDAETPRAKKIVHADDYTVGWICALPKEALPASLLLDEEYETILDDPTDQNAYFFGRMGDHNVVIAILPKGTYGQVQTAVVGTNLLRSFVSIRFCFLVGIGAGIPSADCDIRLGDVVVSAPDGGTGAFVQFDFGSQNADGSFRLKSRPVSPPLFLLNAVSKFETDHGQMNVPLLRYILDVQRRQEHLRARFQYPGAEHDHLFPPEYNCHTADSGGVCQGCDRSFVDPRRLGPRSSAAPVVHYGVIASGGKLVRDPFLRDHLMNKYKARCIEMEAGGIINNIDCLVIRGISDYADSHKNDIWHDYAALTASACAKAILGYVHAVPAQGSRKAMEARRKIEEAKRRHQAVVDHIAPYDFSRRYADVLSQRHGNTGQWFLDTLAFQKWLTDKGRTLWCSGVPGAGKSVLLATAIQYIQSRFAKKANTAVLFAFCNNRDTVSQTGENMIASLWRQLIRRRILSDVECAELEASYLDAGIRPTPKTLVELLSSEMRRYKRVAIFVDALDELTVKSRDALLFFLRELPSQRSLFLTSRFLYDKSALPGDCEHIEIRATEEDLWEYIDCRIQANSRLRSKIKSLITQKAGGMFLLARLHVETIENRFTIRDILAALENLPEGKNAITETYDNAMQRIKDQSAPDRELADKIMLWISHIREPLTLHDLQCALTIREGDTGLDFDDLIPGELLISTCAGLVHVEKETNRLQFVHSTVQEYILATKSSKYPDGDAQMAHVCIQFLSLDLFRIKHDTLTVAQFRNIITTFPFLRYAAGHWGFHARFHGLE